MKFGFVAVALAAAAVCEAFSPLPTQATVQQRQGKPAVTLRAETTTTRAPFFADAVVGEDEDDESTKQGVAGRMLRNSVLTSADGKPARLGDAMGDGTSVVVFLRHMG